ncbi:MAG: hypothetical protein RL281_966 [Pseudomonadota bacterium]
MAREHEAAELTKSQNGNETQADTPKPSGTTDTKL